MNAPETNPLRDLDQAATWLRGHVCGSLHTDSRQVKAGDGFIAWPGAATDGRRYVQQALAAGAAACLVEQDGAQDFGFNDKRIATYAGLKAATGPLAALYFGQPSEHLRIAAVTGTNGKTSTSWWLAQALSRLGQRCGLIGTLGVGEPLATVDTGLTTPDPVLLQQQLRAFVDQGFQACALEASSIGLQEHRLYGTAITLAIFTNFSQDHLDYHGSMAAYWAAKAQLFQWPGLQAAVINIDDPQGRVLNDSLHGRSMEVWTVSCTQPARLQARHIRADAAGLQCEVVEGEQCHQWHVPVVGHYNIANLLGVVAALRFWGFGLAQALQACTALLPVPGRTEVLAFDGQPMVVVDYAHTPDALQKVLSALRVTATARAGQLWCVFGCGGDRDASKRPLMAAVAEQYADQVVVSSDNPRGENPLHIISQVLLGLGHRDAVHVQPDRAQAIHEAVRQAQAADVILLAGKGHENFQDIAGQKLPFSDLDQAVAALQKRQGSQPVQTQQS